MFNSLLTHGQDPVRVLGAAGWQVTRALDVELVGAGRHAASGLLVRYQVRKAQAARVAGPTPPPARDAGLRVVPGEEPVPHRRVAAYAVVECGRGVLMTQLSGLTDRAGSWGLPGGGLDAGEGPGQAVVREVREETGQGIEVRELLQVQTAHWVGRAPGGRLEDFHAVRVVFRGHCAGPTDPVVHDVGGTTESAVWVPWHEVFSLDLTPSSRVVLAGLDPARRAGGGDDAPGPGDR